MCARVSRNLLNVLLKSDKMLGETWQNDFIQSLDACGRML